MTRHVFTLVCPPVVNDKGDVVSGGHGGWTTDDPNERCAECGGKTQPRGEYAEIDLLPRRPVRAA